MPLKTPKKQKFLNLINGMDESTAFAGAHLIFECCQAYQKEFGILDADIITAVYQKLGIDERMTVICSHWPNLFHSLQKVRYKGRNGEIRQNLPETDRIGFDAYLTMNQLRRLGGSATASRLQSVMSGCHEVPANDLKKALAVLQKLELIAEEQSPSGQWWNPRRSYYMKDSHHGPITNEDRTFQPSSLSEALTL